MADEPFLSRWSKRNTAARTRAPLPAEASAAAPLVAAPQVPAPPAADTQAPEPLPAVESLTPDSDFTGFMQPEVDEDVKRRALKTLFQDPRFNVMDGLDVYIDDYSKPDPMPESWLGKLNQMARLGAFEEKPGAPPEPPQTPPPEATGPGPEPVEQPLPEQGIVPTPSSDTSDTPDGGVAAPPVPE